MHSNNLSDNLYNKRSCISINAKFLPEQPANRCGTYFSTKDQIVAILYRAIE